MAIEVTWENIVKAIALTAVLLGLVLTGGATIMQMQLTRIDTRLSERLTIYHREQEQQYQRMDRIEQQLQLLRK